MASKALTPRAGNKTTGNAPVTGKKLVGAKTPAKAVPAKTQPKGKPNASILNFFKKVDNPLLEDEIFVKQRVGESGLGGTVKQKTPQLLGEADLYGNGEEDGEAARFNEAGSSVKRRRISPSARETGDMEALDVQKMDTKPTGTTECSPPPPEPTAEPMTKNKKSKPKRRGPFLSDSDTDDDVDNFAIQKTAVEAEKRELRSSVRAQPDAMNELVKMKPIEQEGIHQNKPVVPEVESVKPVKEVVGKRRRVPVARAQAKWEAMQPNTPSTDGEKSSSSKASNSPSSPKEDRVIAPPAVISPVKEDPVIPALKKENTSMDDWGNFEDTEGFPVDEDDEFADGEEFVERKWMEEQARLEAAEMGDEEALTDALENDLEDQAPDEETTSKCPICDSSLKGVHPDLATRHVNGCLDGNPIPLPVIKKEPLVVEKESAEAKYLPPEAKNRFARKAAIARPGQANPFEIGSVGAAPSSAFSKLMSGKAEDAAWAAASAAEQSSRGKPAFERTCPFYKIMPGFNICVDAFRYGAVQGCNAYFLSHFHSDHYIGLTSTWCHGPIYCSKVTGNLVKQQLRVDPKWVVSLDFDERFEVPGTNGVAVSMIPANHCPGSSLYLFEKVVGKGANPKVQRVLHCGDFRACPAHIAHPLLMPDLVDTITGKTKQQKIDVCYLDTTYLNPRYAFPSQEEVIKACADMCVSLKKERAEESDAWEVAKRERAGTGMTKFISSALKPEDDSIAMSLTTKSEKPRGRLLVICGTYSIGKERICLGIARALDCKIWAPPGKMRICRALEDPELMARMTPDPKEAQIHMQMLMEIRAETLQEYLNGYKPHFSRIVGFRPSGWNYKPPTSRFTTSPSVSTILHSVNWRSSYSMAELVPQRGSTREASCFGVPYSEHSSFRELTMFVCALRIEKVVPTVNVGSAPGRAKMKAWIERWLAERKKADVVKIGGGEGEVRW